MPYADDSIWLLFGLGVAIIVAVAAYSLLFNAFGWASYGFLLTGVLIAASYYIVGSAPSREKRVEHDVG